MTTETSKQAFYLVLIKEYCRLLYVVCRKQDNLNFRNIHVDTYTFLKTMFKCQSAALGSVDIF